MSHLAQDELDQYFNNHDHLRSHPEDLSRSDESENEKTDYVPTQTVGDPDDDDDDGDDEEEHSKRNMATMTQTRTTYQLPSTLFDANTGPKGVIADAHSFERAKKRSFRRTLMDLTNGITLGSRSSHEKTNYNNDKLSSSVSSGTSEGDDEEFMRQWREKRIQEMAAGTVRRQSPSKRKYGNLDAVDAEGFLDAVEKVPADTVVVVCIYDPESNVSAAVEEPLNYLARKHCTTRFVKLHYEVAEMEHVSVPAILAYRRGDVFATLMDFKLDGADGGVSGLEGMMKRENIFS